MVKKDGVVIVKKPHLLNMFPSFYLLHLQQQLKATEYLTLKILVYLLEGHKQVSLELLAFLMPYPIQFESRAANTRFFKLDCLQIERLWFPIVQEILKEKFKNHKSLKVAIDRTSVAIQKRFCN